MPRPCKHEVRVTERAGAKGGLAEREVEVPGPLEAAVVAEPAHLVDPLVEARPPPVERLGVVLTDLVDAIDPESGVPRRRLRQRLERRNQTTGEDVALDPVGRAPVTIPALLRHEDRLQRRAAARSEDAV